MFETIDNRNTLLGNDLKQETIYIIDDLDLLICGGKICENLKK